MPSLSSVRRRAVNNERLSWREMKKLANRVRLASAGTGTAVALPAALLVSHLSTRAVQEGVLRESRLFMHIYPDIAWGVLAFALFWLLLACAARLRLQPFLMLRLTPDADGARLWRLCRKKAANGRRPGLLYACASMAAGMGIGAIAPPLLTPEGVLPLFLLELFTTGAGAGTAVACVLRSRLYARMYVVGTDFTPAKPRWKAFFAGWLLIAVLYVGASLAFQIFMLFLFLPVAALLVYGLARWVNGRVRFRALDWVFTVFRALLAAALALALCAAAVFSGLWVNNMYIYTLDSSVFPRARCDVRYNEENGVFTLVPRESELRILQLTDLHIGGSLTTAFADRKAFAACYALIREAQPDLIILTGDIAYPIPVETFTRNNDVAFSQLRYFMDMVNIPWTFFYGNHDTEKSALLGGDAILREYVAYARRNPEMLFADVQPDIYGRYNQYLRVEDPDGTLRFALFLIDSNDYAQGPDAVGKYDSVHADQIQWYEDTLDALRAEAGHVVPSFVFMHIPFRAFADAQTALETGDPAAEYLFGQNGEGVSCPAKESGFFDAILKKGSTRAVFVGHDHLNNLAVRYKGVDLVYYKYIDYIAYPGIANRTAQRGATLITLKGDQYTLQSLSLPANDLP